MMAAIAPRANTRQKGLDGRHRLNEARKKRRTSVSRAALLPQKDDNESARDLASRQINRRTASAALRGYATSHAGEKDKLTTLRAPSADPITRTYLFALRCTCGKRARARPRRLRGSDAPPRVKPGANDSGRWRNPRFVRDGRKPSTMPKAATRATTTAPRDTSQPPRGAGDWEQAVKWQEEPYVSRAEPPMR